MAEDKIPLRNIQITFRPSSPVTKIALVCAIVLCAASMITLRWSQNRLLKETEELEQQAAQLIIDNEKLEKKIKDVDSVQSIQEIAQDELDMLYPDQQLFEPKAE